MQSLLIHPLFVNSSKEHKRSIPLPGECKTAPEEILKIEKVGMVLGSSIYLNLVALSHETPHLVTATLFLSDTFFRLFFTLSGHSQFPAINFSDLIDMLKFSTKDKPWKMPYLIGNSEMQRNYN
jgi:hypothetical protein